MGIGLVDLKIYDLLFCMHVSYGSYVGKPLVSKLDLVREDVASQPSLGPVVLCIGMTSAEVVDCSWAKQTYPRHKRALVAERP